MGANRTEKTNQRTNEPNKQTIGSFHEKYITKSRKYSVCTEIMTGCNKKTREQETEMVAAVVVVMKTINQTPDNQFHILNIQINANKKQRLP